LFSWMYFFLASIYPTKKKGSMLQFDDLPESIIYDIFALLPPEDLVQWSQVNHKFCRIAGDSYLWKHFVKRCLFPDQSFDDESLDWRKYFLHWYRAFQDTPPGQRISFCCQYDVTGEYFERTRAQCNPEEWVLNVSTFLSVATCAGNPRITRRLLENQASPNLAPGRLGDPPLVEACRARSLETVSVLLEYQANVEAEDFSGHSPLSMAVAFHDIAIVRRLLQANAEVNRAGLYRTALHVCCQGQFPSQFRLAKLLLKYGADPTLLPVYSIPASSADDPSPMPWASSQLVSLLNRYGAQLDPQLRHTFM